MGRMKMNMRESIEKENMWEKRINFFLKGKYVYR